MTICTFNQTLRSLRGDMRVSTGCKLLLLLLGSLIDLPFMIDVSDRDIKIGEKLLFILETLVIDA